MYKILVKKSIEKQLSKLPTTYYKAISKTIDELGENPRPAGYRKLENENNKYRVRVGIYRIIYSIYDDVLVVEVISVGHRKDIYRTLRK